MLRQQEDTIQLDNKLLDGEVDMMALHNHYFQKSRRPLHHPNEHKTHELELIRKKYKRYSRDGLAEIYVQCQRRGYKRSYGAMKKMIKKLQLTEKKEKRTYPKSKWTPIPTTYPGEKVQIDIKYVPLKQIMDVPMIQK